MECKVNVEQYSASSSGGGRALFHVPNGDSAAHRARWLAELSEALDDARLLLAEFEGEHSALDAHELKARIEAARREVMTLRLRTSGGGGQDFGPQWSDNLPWKRSA